MRKHNRQGCVARHPVERFPSPTREIRHPHHRSTRAWSILPRRAAPAAWAVRQGSAVRLQRHADCGPITSRIDQEVPNGSKPAPGLSLSGDEYLPPAAYVGFVAGEKLAGVVSTPKFEVEE